MSWPNTCHPDCYCYSGDAPPCDECKRQLGGGQEPTAWRNLPAGPELDALIAERVLGPPIPPPNMLPLCRFAPRCSRTWAGAGLVVEAMERRGWRLDLLRRPAGDWEAALWPRVGPPEVEHADTAPLAISRAALAAMETEEER